MPARFNISVLSRRGPVKLALVSLISIVCRSLNLYRISSKKFSMVALRGVALMGILSLAIMAWAMRGHIRLAGDETLATPNRETAQTAQNSGIPVQVLLLTVRSTGFDPKEVDLPAGYYLLAVDNRSGVDDLSIGFDVEGGGRLKNINSKRRIPDWRGFFELTPGNYKLTVASYPTWECKIKIAPKK